MDSSHHLFYMFRPELRFRQTSMAARQMNSNGVINVLPTNMVDEDGRSALFLLGGHIGRPG
jgi:hypothetical protein